MKKLIFSLLTLLLFNCSYGAGDVTYKNINKFFKSYGVGKKYSEEGIAALKELVNITRDQVNKDPEKFKKSQNKFLDHSIDLIDEAQTTSNHKTKQSHFIQVKRILYSVLSMPYVGRKLSIWEVVKTPFKMSVRAQTYIQLLNKKDLNSPVEKKAKHEASYLFHKSGNSFFTKNELKKFTPLEISHFDVSEDHPQWHTRAYMKKHPNPWKDLEDYVNERSQKKIKKKYSITTKYNLKKAKKVLFFSKIKDTATSPKVTGKDAFGMKWKLKWGGETQVEPIVNRLYAYLGAKFIDLTYANKPGLKGTVLILKDPAKGDSCDHISSVKTFKKCFYKSKYKFDSTPYIFDSAIINNQNIKTISTLLPKGSEKLITEKTLMGRTYITFKTSMVEYNGSSIFTRGGPTPGSSLGALKDRAARGLYLFHAWIWNNDAKDENNKAYLLKKFKGNKKIYIETQHDMGSSMGKRGNAGRISTLREGFKFAHVDEKNQLVIKQLTLYRPRAWTKATHSDLLWMAYQLADLSVFKIKEAISASNWPKFMQDLAVYKLVARRNYLLKLLNLNHLIKEILDPPQYIIDLTTEQKKLEVAIDLNLPKEEWLSYLRGVSKVETVINKYGRLSNCGKSHLVNFMEQHTHPEGLERRQKRSNDKRSLSICSPY